MRMFSLSAALTILSCTVYLASSCILLEPENIVLNTDDPNSQLFHQGEDNTVLSGNGRCRLTLKNDGNLVLERRKENDDEWQTRWESGGGHNTDGAFYAELNDKGKLKIFGMKGNEKEVVFSVNNADPPGEEAEYYIFGIGAYTKEEFGDWRQKCDLRVQSFSNGVCKEEWVNSCDDIQENVVMRSDVPSARRFYAGEGNAHVARNGKCRLRLGDDGNLLLEGRESIQTEYWKTYWESGGGHNTEGTYVAALTKEGDLRVIDEGQEGNNEVIFSTNTGGVGRYKSLYHELSIVTSRRYDEVPCRLKLWNSPNEENYDRCSERWSNVKYGFQTQPYWGNFDHSLYTFDVIQKGEMFIDGEYWNACASHGSPNYPMCPNSEVCPYVTLYLQPNCNLVIFDGKTLADRGSIIWSANIEGDYSKDCYLLADEDDSGLKLYEGKYNKHGEDNGSDVGKVIWSMYDHYYNGYGEGLVHVRLCANGPIV